LNISIIFPTGLQHISFAIGFVTVFFGRKGLNLKLYIVGVGEMRGLGFKSGER
jgi:hypothetical protein